MDQALNILSYLNLFSLLVPISMGLFRWPRLITSLRFAWAGLLVYFLLFALMMLATLGYVTGIDNFEWLSYLITGLFGAAFAVCYALAVPKGPARLAISGLGTLGALGILIEFFWHLSSLSASQWAIPAQTVINTLVSLIYLHHLTRTTTVSLLTVPLFWISIGRLVSCLLSSLYDFLRVPMAESSRDLLIQWLCFQFALTIGCNIIYGIGFWKARTNRPVFARLT